MPASLILVTISRMVFHTIIVFSLYLLLSGHNTPGGGFVGGLVAGAALVLAYATGGVSLVRRTVRVRPEAVIGVGLAVAQITAIAGWLGGGDVLQSTIWSWELPLFGKVKLVSALFFDIGVYFVVVGLVAKTLQTLGAQEPS